LEVLVIIVIVCVVAAICVPVFHARAKLTVLSVNLQTLASTVAEEMLEGYSLRYRASGDGDSERYLSTHLEENLKALGAAGYVNPLVSSKEGHLVLNSNVALTNPPLVAPAVLITGSLEFQYCVFDSLPQADRLRFAGSLIVAFNIEARTVDVFFVDKEGERSAEVRTAAG
jgi:hypothetical protein